MPVILGNASRPSFDAAGAMLQNKQIETNKAIALAKIKAANQRAAMGMAENAIGMLNQNAQRDKDRAMAEAQRASQMRVAQQNAQTARGNKLAQDVARENQRWRDFVNQWKMKGMTHDQGQMLELMKVDQKLNDLIDKYNKAARDGDHTVANALLGEMLNVQQERWKFQPETRIPQTFETDPVSGRRFTRGPNGGIEWVDEKETPQERIKKENDAHRDRQATQRLNIRKEANDQWRAILPTLMTGDEWNRAAEALIADTRAQLIGAGADPGGPESQYDPTMGIKKPTYWKRGSADSMTPRELSAERLKMLDRRNKMIESIRKESGGTGEAVFKTPESVKSEFDRRWKESGYDAVEQSLGGGETSQTDGNSKPAEPGIPQGVTEAESWLKKADEYVRINAGKLSPTQIETIVKQREEAKKTINDYRQSQGMAPVGVPSGTGQPLQAAPAQPAAQQPAPRQVALGDSLQQPVPVVQQAPYQGKVIRPTAGLSLGGNVPPVATRSPLDQLPAASPQRMMTDQEFNLPKRGQSIASQTQAGLDKAKRDAVRDVIIDENLPKSPTGAARPLPSIEPTANAPTKTVDGLAALPLVRTVNDAQVLSNGDKFRDPDGGVYELIKQSDGSIGQRALGLETKPAAKDEKSASQVAAEAPKSVTIYGKSPTGEMPKKSDQDIDKAMERTAESNAEINDAESQGQLPFDVEWKYDDLPRGATKFPAYSWTDKDGKKQVSDNWRGVHKFIDEVSKSMGVGKHDPETQAQAKAEEAAAKQEAEQAKYQPRPLPPQIGIDHGPHLTPQAQEAHLRSPKAATRQEFGEAFKNKFGSDASDEDYQNYIDAREAVRSQLPKSASDTAPGNLFLDPKTGELKQNDGGKSRTVPDSEKLPRGYDQTVPLPKSNLGANQPPPQQRQVGPADMARGAAAARQKMADEAANSPAQRGLDRLDQQQQQDARGFGQPRGQANDPRRKAAEDRLRMEQQRLEELRKQAEEMRDGVKDRIKQMENNRVFPFPPNVSQNQYQPTFNDFSSQGQFPQMLNIGQRQPDYSNAMSMNSLGNTFWPQETPNYMTPQYQTSYSVPQYDQQPLSYYEPQYSQPQFDYMPQSFDFQPSYQPVGADYFGGSTPYQYQPYIGGMDSFSYGGGDFFYGGGYNDAVGDYSNYV